MTPVPEGLSPASERLWLALHAAYDFEVDSDELCRRALARFDLADELLVLARQQGLTTPAGRGALSGSRDAEMCGLKLMQAVGLDKADVEALRRPGRPPGTGWNNYRRVGPQPRDPLTGQPLRMGLT